MSIALAPVRALMTAASPKKRSHLFQIVFVMSLAGPASAAQVDLPAPPGSYAFGADVAVLPNGNIVVTDPYQGVTSGAVYLYSPNGTLISTLSGSSGDQVGSGGVVVLPNGNFVVSSPDWNAGRGAATWVDGTAGLEDSVSSSNSLTGIAPDSHVSSDGITVLANGNYVVISSVASTTVLFGGEVTWCNGATGKPNDNTGFASIANSVVGATQGDNVGIGGVTALTNGNYVVSTPLAKINGVLSAGAMTWVNGTTGLTSDSTTAVSASNSLVGAAQNDYVGLGGAIALSNGNYVVPTATFKIGGNAGVGAATWVNGATGQTKDMAHVPSAANSLVGSSASDSVANGGVVALAGGNYVVASTSWNSSSGAATWGDGSAGSAGAVSAGNSLTGASAGDKVGLYVSALSNGNYVVDSYEASVGASSNGAVTWVNGSNGSTKNGLNVISSANSLLGQTGDKVGYSGVWPLTNGNYVVASGAANVGAAMTGAVTLGNGATGTSGTVSLANSLVGAANDQIGVGGVTALSNGNFVVASFYASFGANHTGAATWVDGADGHTSNHVNAISAGNSLIGAVAEDRVAYGQSTILGIVPLANGNYVVVSPVAGVGGIGRGAVTFGNGATGYTSVISAQNSLVGTIDDDGVGAVDNYTASVLAFADGNYAVRSAHWSGVISDGGAVTLASSRFRAKGTLQPYNSVLGQANSGGAGMVTAYDATRQRLVVGRSGDNIVSLFTMDQILADGVDG